MSYNEIEVFLKSQILSIIFIIIPILVSFYIYNKQQKRRRLTYQCIASIPLLTVKEELAGRLSVEFDGQAVKSIRTTTVLIKNAGNQPIESDHYVRPLFIMVRNGAKILSADIVLNAPLYLSPVLDLIYDGVSVKPILLNPGDSFVVKLLVQDGCDYVGVVGRIVGVKNCERVYGPAQQLQLKVLIASFVGIVGIGISILLGAEKAPTERNIFDYIGLTFLSLGWFSMAYYIIFDFYQKNKKSD